MSRALLLLFPLLGLCLATPLELEPLSDSEIFFINSVQSTWTAGRNFPPEDLERVKGLLGVNMEAHEELMKILNAPESEAEIRDDLPTEFDPRTKWPNCKSLSEIRDQASCGSCWAFGASEAMTDRTCIHTNQSVHISSEDINDCCDSCGFGCRGGMPYNAWVWYHNQGVVSGGNYNSSEGCMPYSIPNCDHHTTGGKYKPCGDIVPTPRCTRRCRDGYPKEYNDDKNFGQGPRRFSNEKSIMQELVDNGPISAAFGVYSDFLSYKSGVYKHTTGGYLGGHAIKILGYGEEQGEAYWLVANSWNEDWGDKGYFKIARGHDECGIESQGVASIPRKSH